MPVNLEKRKRYLKQYYLDHKADYVRRGKEWDASHRGIRVEYTMNWRGKNKEKHRLYSQKWREENRQKIRAKQATPEYKKAMRAYCRKHYQKNKEKYILKTDKRRALLAGAAINLEGIQAWCSRVRGQKTFTCYWCEKRTSRSKLHFDHIIPISRGGQHSVSNLCASCNECNWEKGNKLVEEWKKTHGGINEI
jgi:5-methylcytosine-specific restriction endonuclease McrA